MQFGWCAPLATAGMIAEAGYDYIELPLAAQGLEEGAVAVRARVAEIKRSPVPARAFNYFFPRDMRIVGDGVDRARLDEYLARAGELMGAVGARAAVMGSAWARNVPDGFDRGRAEDQIVAALGMIADRMEGTGVTVVIEPLYRQESNIINSVAEGVGFARRVGRPEIRVLADFFHMNEEGEPHETMYEHRDWLAHVHLADTGRKAPGTGTYDYDRFFGQLRKAGYQGMMSAECSADDPRRDMASSLAFVRRRWPD